MSATVLCMLPNLCLALLMLLAGSLIPKFHFWLNNVTELPQLRVLYPDIARPFDQ